MRRTAIALAWRKMALCLAGSFCLSMCAPVRAQTIVDCTGATSGAFTTITAALAGTSVLGANIQVVAGPCNENVIINGRYNLNLGAQSGKTVVLNGKIAIQNSENVYVYGFNVTNLSGNGIIVSVSRGVTLDTVTSNGNKKNGLAVAGFADVVLYGPSAFQNNSAYGAVIQEQAALDIETSAGALNVSNNAAGGFFVYNGAGLSVAGNTMIENNGNGGIGHQVGIAVHENSTLELDDCTGSNLIQGNAISGIEVQGSSTAAVVACGAGFQNLIENNGSYGAAVLLSSEMVVNGEAQFSGSPQAGIFVDGAASLFLNGSALITNNGTPGNTDTGGVVIGNGSALEAHHAQVNANSGWAFVGFLGGDLNIYGTTATGNEFGIVGCDSSASLDTDFSPNAGLIACAIPTVPPVLVAKPLNGQRAIKPAVTKLPETETPDPAAMAEKVRTARAAFWKAMNGGTMQGAPVGGPVRP